MEKSLERVVELLEKMVSYYEKASALYEVAEKSNQEVKEAMELIKTWESNSQ